MTTVWLLDVDGVLNAQDPGWGAAPYNARVGAFRIRWAPALLQRIRRLIQSGAVEVRWSSTWCGDTEGLEQAFNLPHLADAFTVPRGRYVGDLKLAATRKVLADGHRLIWTDDDETPEDGPLFDQLTRDGRALLIRPDSRRGLQPEDMDRIERFARVEMTA